MTKSLYNTYACSGSIVAIHVVHLRRILGGTRGLVARKAEATLASLCNTFGLMLKATEFCSSTFLVNAVYSRVDRVAAGAADQLLLPANEVPRAV